MLHGFAGGHCAHPGSTDCGGVLVFCWLVEIIHRGAGMGCDIEHDSCALLGKLLGAVLIGRLEYRQEEQCQVTHCPKGDQSLKTSSRVAASRMVSVPGSSCSSVEFLSRYRVASLRGPKRRPSSRSSTFSSHCCMPRSVARCSTLVTQGILHPPSSCSISCHGLSSRPSGRRIIQSSTVRRSRMRALPALPVEQPDEGAVGLVARFGVVFGLPVAQVGGVDQREGVVVALKWRQPRTSKA